MYLLFLRRRLYRIFRFDLLFSFVASADLVRFFVDDIFFLCGFVGVIDDVLDDLVFFAFVAFRDQLGCLRDHPDVVGIAERVVACCADRVFRPVCGAICDVACVVRERVVVELVQEVLPDVRERLENRLRDRPPEAGHGAIREVLVLSRLGQHHAEAILAKELRAARNLVVELFDDLLRGPGEFKRQRLVPDLERNDEVRSDHGAVPFARKRNRAERRLHLLGVRVGIADEHVNGGAQRGERLRGAVETRVDAPVPGVAQERVHAVHPQAVRDLHHGGAAVHRRLHRLFARLAREQREELLVRGALLHQRLGLAVHALARLADAPGLRDGRPGVASDGGVESHVERVRHVVAEDVAHLLARERREAPLQRRACAVQRRLGVRRDAEPFSDLGDLLRRHAFVRQRLDERLLDRHRALRVDFDAVEGLEGHVVVDLLEAGDLSIAVGRKVDLPGVIFAVGQRSEVVERDCHCYFLKARG